MLLCQKAGSGYFVWRCTTGFARNDEHTSLFMEDFVGNVPLGELFSPLDSTDRRMSSREQFRRAVATRVVLTCLEHKRQRYGPEDDYQQLLRRLSAILHVG